LDAGVPELRNACHTSLGRRACAGDINIHNDGRNTIDGTGSEFRISPNCRITDATRKFNDPVMYLDTNCSDNHIRFTIKLSEYVSLNLHIIFHQAVPS
jgi:hypothetical protein